MRIQRMDKTRFEAAEVIIKDENITGRNRNKYSERAIKKLFDEDLPKIPEYNEALKNAPNGTTVVPRVGSFDSNIYLIDIKKNDVLQNIYSVTFPIESVGKKKTITKLGETIAKALNKIG